MLNRSHKLFRHLNQFTEKDETFVPPKSLSLAIVGVVDVIDVPINLLHYTRRSMKKYRHQLHLNVLALCIPIDVL